MKKNWIPNTPTQAWFDGTWKLKDVERVQQKRLSSKRFVETFIQSGP